MAMAHKLLETVKRNLPLQPGLLRLFRLSLVVQLILVTVVVIAHHRAHYLVHDARLTLAVSIGGNLALLAYLRSARAQRWLRWRYLPLALLASAVHSLVLQDIFMIVGASADRGGSEERAWLLFIFLFIPLVLTAWQYDFKAVAAFCLFTAFLDHILIQVGGGGFAADSSVYDRLILVRTLSFLVVGYIVARIVTQMRAQQLALQQANDKLAHYASTLEQLTVSRERNRMARELHDTLAHTLSGVAVQLEGIKSLWDSDPRRAYGLLNDSLAATRSGLVETRAAIRALRSQPLETLGIELALQELGRSAAERAGFHLRFEAPPQGLELSDDVEQCLYRVGQEALENIAAHAGAGEVLLRLERGPQAVRLTICDDGRGFVPPAPHAEPAGHFGLRGMRERAELAGGRLAVKSHPGQGASVQLEIPL